RRLGFVNRQLQPPVLDVGFEHMPVQAWRELVELRLVREASGIAGSLQVGIRALRANQGREQHKGEKKITQSHRTECQSITCVIFGKVTRQDKAVGRPYDTEENVVFRYNDRFSQAPGRTTAMNANAP